MQYLGAKSVHEVQAVLLTKYSETQHVTLLNKNCVSSPLSELRIKIGVASMSQLWASSTFLSVFGASITSPHMNSSYNKKMACLVFQNYF